MIFGVLALGLFMLTSLGVGIGSIRLWWRTRKLPELSLGLAVLCIGFLAFAVGTIGKLYANAPESTRLGLTLAGLSTEYVGDVALIVFAWRAFRPRTTWASVLALAIFLTLVAAFAGEVASGAFSRYSDGKPISGPYVVLGLAARGIPAGWVTIECLQYYSMLRRRLRLGLAHPLVVNRVLMWGVAMGALVGAVLASIIHRLAYGTGLRQHPWALSVVAVLALTSALSIALAFFPPHAYRSWVIRRAE